MAQGKERYREESTCMHSGLPAAPVRVWAEQSSECSTARSTAQSNANGHISPPTRATNTCTDASTDKTTIPERTDTARDAYSGAAGNAGSPCDGRSE